MITVYIWSFRGKSAAWGHASMAVGREYISWWPETPGQVLEPGLDAERCPALRIEHQEGPCVDAGEAVVAGPAPLAPFSALNAVASSLRQHLWAGNRGGREEAEGKGWDGLRQSQEKQWLGRMPDGK